LPQISGHAGPPEPTKALWLYNDPSRYEFYIIIRKIISNSGRQAWYLKNYLAYGFWANNLLTNHLIGKSMKKSARHDNQIMAQNGIKTHKNDISQMEHVLAPAKLNDAKSLHI